MAMPKAHRDALDEGGVTELVVTASTSKCLNVYLKDAWLEIEKKIMSAPNVRSKGVQRIQRLYVGYATPVELDSAGRVLLSSELRAFAGIDRKVMLVGQGKKFELWDVERWEREFGLCDDQDIDTSDVPESVLEDMTL
jgi:MraZ protein